MKVTKQSSETQRKVVGNMTIAWELLATFQTWGDFRQSVSKGLMPGKAQETKTPAQGLVVTSALLSGLFLSLLKQFKCHYCIFSPSLSMHTI